MDRKEEKQRITILSAKDLDISYSVGSGKGGQAKQRTSSKVTMIHRESGAMGVASDSRSQLDNKRLAFDRLRATPKFKVWLNKKLFEIREQETLEKSIEKETTPDKLKFEVKLDGKWVEVSNSHFDSESAKKEN